MSIFDKTAEMLLYLTVSLLFLMIVMATIITRYRKESLKDFWKYIIGIGTGYSFAASSIMLLLKFDEMRAEGSFNGEIFYPILGLLLLCVVLILVGIVISIFKKEWIKKYAIAAFTLAGGYLLILLIINLVGVYKGQVQIGKEIALMASTVAIAAVLVALTLFGKKFQWINNTKATVYAAICVSLSFALSYIRIFRLPQGGSVTLASLLPLMVYSYIFGVRKGVMAGFIYGLLQAIQDPWIIHPLQFLLDYPLAFSMVGLTGLFRERKMLNGKANIQFLFGGILVAVLRYACHVITGIIVFDIYAPDTFNAVAWGFLYNLFVYADIAIAITAGVLMLSTKSGRKIFDTPIG